jgi:transcriptional regulator with XRE-family HTH domain
VSSHDNPLRALRKNAGLNLLQAAEALGTSASAIEKMEGQVTAIRTAEEIETSYRLFLEKSSDADSKNLIFGLYPLRIGRELLQLSLEEMARKYNYTPNTWRRIESKARPLSVTVIAKIEDEVRAKLRTILKEPD